MNNAAKVVAGAIAAVGAVGLWWRKHPSACPYSQRFWVEAPHPLITRERLMEILAPVEGEHLLEIGPGTGYYTLDVATALGEGTLEIFDLQQEMLDHTMHRAFERGLENIVPMKGDATKLPYEDSVFDGVLLVTVLGEIPDQRAALSEIVRVLKPGGRVVVGELAGDPHMVRLRDLVRNSSDAGLDFESRTGPAFGYFARFKRY